MRKVIAVDGTHLHGKYEGVLLGVVAQDTENHVYPIAFCFMDKEIDASWTFFFEKLKEIVIDEPDLCFISGRHKSIANSIVNVYNHAHHGYCMRHLGENLRVNHHCGDYIYLYYNAAKAYSLEEFDNHFVEFKNKCPAAAVVLRMILVLRSGAAHIFLAIDMMERHTYILKSMGNQMVPTAEKIARKKMIEGDSLEYDLIKILCAHAMTVLRSKHGNEYGMSIYEYSSPLY
ncbi:hypothetical protein KY289_033184 [Solanum tuberosum]|nr:hypothetical protein KY289_033184 [Solanum tuberosum]